MKKININCQMQNKHFLIVIYHPTLVRVAINDARVCQMCNGVKKRFNFFFFHCKRQNKDHIALVNCGGIEFFKLR